MCGERARKGKAVRMLGWGFASPWRSVPTASEEAERAEGRAAVGAQLPGSHGRRRSRGWEPTFTTCNEGKTGPRAAEGRKPALTAVLLSPAPLHGVRACHRAALGRLLWLPVLLHGRAAGNRLSLSHTVPQIADAVPFIGRLGK